MVSEGIYRREATPRELTTRCSPHLMVIPVLLFRNYFKILKTVNDLFQRRQQNNYGTGQKTIWIKHISDCQGL
jgi:hypothetical protein